jgi:hypothetical protein
VTYVDGTEVVGAHFAAAAQKCAFKQDREWSERDIKHKIKHCTKRMAALLASCEVDEL